MNCGQLKEKIKAIYCSRNSDFMELFLGKFDTLTNASSIHDVIKFMLAPWVHVKTNKGLYFFSRMIETWYVRDGFIVKLNGLANYRMSMKYFINTLKKKWFPPKWAMVLKNIYREELADLIEAIWSIWFPPDFQLDLSDNSFTAVVKFLDALGNCWFTEGLKIYLIQNWLWDTGAQYLLDVIKKKPLKAGAQIFLGSNYLTQGMQNKFFEEAERQWFPPETFNFSLSNSPIEAPY